MHIIRTVEILDLLTGAVPEDVLDQLEAAGVNELSYPIEYEKIGRHHPATREQPEELPELQELITPAEGAARLLEQLILVIPIPYLRQHRKTILQALAAHERDYFALRLACDLEAADQEES